MSERGETAVDTPPVSGVDAYSKNNHVGGGGHWEPATPPRIISSNDNKKSPQSNASVTKISSGDARSLPVSKNSRRRKNKDKKISLIGISDEEEELSCSCDGWNRAKQLKHDLVELNKIHDTVLTGLRDQLDEVKQKNKDLLMNLIISSSSSVKNVHEQEPENYLSLLSSKGESIDRSNLSSNKNEDFSRKENEIKDNIQEQYADNSETRQRTHKNAQIEQLNQVPSVDNLEVLKNENEHLKQLLEDEIAKNEYLRSELKRRVYEQTGQWYPPPYSNISTKEARKKLPQLKEIPSDVPSEEKSIEKSPLKLPHISELNQNILEQHGIQDLNEKKVPVKRQENTKNKRKHKRQIRDQTDNKFTEDSNRYEGEENISISDRTTSKKSNFSEFLTQNVDEDQFGSESILNPSEGVTNNQEPDQVKAQGTTKGNRNRRKHDKKKLGQAAHVDEDKILTTKGGEDTTTSSYDLDNKDTLSQISQQHQNKKKSKYPSHSITESIDTYLYNGILPKNKNVKNNGSE